MNSNETLQVLGSNKQNYRVALLSAIGTLRAYFFPSNFNVLFQCPPLKEIDVAGNGGRINMNNKLFLLV